MHPGNTIEALPPEQRKLLLARIREGLENTSVRVMRQVARQRGWALRGNATAGLVDQMLGYLGDAQRMRAVFSSLPAEQQEILGWLAALRPSSAVLKPLQVALAEGTGRRMTQKVIDEALQELLQGCLIFATPLGGYEVPELYLEWLPGVKASRLTFAGKPDQVRGFSVTEVIRHAQHLLFAIESDVPDAFLASQPSRAQINHSRSLDSSALRASLVATDVLTRWGYTKDSEQQLARFLLEQLANAGLCGVFEQAGRKQLWLTSLSMDAWESASMVERLGLLRKASLAAHEDSRVELGSWTEIDLALSQESSYSLHSTMPWAMAESLAHQVSRLRLWLTSLVARLEADTWYGLEQFHRLIFDLQRDPLSGQSGLAGNWLWFAGTQVLYPKRMKLNVWKATYGRLLEAWLTGTATWLLLVQVGYRGGRPVAFRRPSSVMIGSAAPAPAGSLRFLADGRAVLQNNWQTGELRLLLRRIGVEDSRNRDVTSYCLDTAAFRRTLQSGTDAAEVIASFTAAGFPLPPVVCDMLEEWQDRAGRYQLYDHVAVVELGQDVLAEEIQAMVGLDRSAFYQVTPHGLILLYPQQVPKLVEELRRRGYTPKVLS